MTISHPTRFAAQKKLLVTYTIVASALLLGACGDDGHDAPPSTSKIKSEISQCGGFEVNASGASYCDAERVVFDYDAAARTLTIEDRRVTLNCCGERSVQVTRDDSGIVVREIDRPENGGARCRCSCTYDFRVTLRDVDAGSLALRVEREVVDAGPADTIFDKAIDLSAGHGESVVDASASSFCAAPSPAALFEAPRVSECGGFVANARSKQSNDSGAGDFSGGYCDAEVLDWQFDAQSGKLSLSNNRVLLNCCGDHSIKVRKEGARYIIAETDAPQQGSRCNCMCVFDFAVDVNSVAGQRIEIAVERTVTDDGQGAQLVYTGALDLSKSSGTLLVDPTDVGPWCEKH